MQAGGSQGVSTLQIRLQACEIAQQMEITEFRGGPSWVLRFMRRKGLSLRSRTTVSQKCVPDFQEKLTNFRQFCCKKIEKHSIDPDHIINMDEVSLQFDMPMDRTVDKVGCFKC